MLKKYGVRFAGLALLAFAAACGDDGTNPAFKMAATVDGGQFRGGVVEATTDSVYLTISGASNTQVMTLHITVPTGPGTVAFHDSTDYAMISEGGGVWSTSLGGTGAVTFTTNNANETSGTFSFTAASSAKPEQSTTRTVTNGTFQVRY